MPDRLHWNTVTPLLRTTLKTLMEEELFLPFRLVGGTSLSLQLGHRMSDDIDLFTDADYNSIDFDSIDQFLRRSFPYVSEPIGGVVGFGRSYFVGNAADDNVKLDLYYTDAFIDPSINIGAYRLATTDEIIAMKIHIVQRNGRKKDFWDLHELLELCSIERMISLHERRYPYNHEENQIRANLINFAEADDDFDPKCLKAKYWEVIKLDLTQKLLSSQQ